MKSARLIFLLFVSTAITIGSSRALENARQIPARAIPVPDTASPELQAMIAAGLSPDWNTHPTSAAEWKAWVQRRADLALKGLPGLREKMGVKVEPGTIAGVKVFTVTPGEISEANRDRLLVHVHGGGYVLSPGEAGTPEAIMMAGYGHIKVVSIDYRMPPDFPYPAAMDDAMAVYKEIVKTTDAKKIAIFGTSTGGGMTLAMVLRAKMEGLPLPAAIAPGTPWSDMTKTGDSYFTNDTVDNVLVSNEGWLGDAAKLYANGHDLKDPLLSPVYGDLHGFPPTILTSGTRDLFLSNTVRVHRKLRDAGVVADLIMFEGMSHAQYLFSADAPENKQHFAELSAFFDKYLAK
jgi:epsilon-lactone hydrolase